MGMGSVAKITSVTILIAIQNLVSLWAKKPNGKVNPQLLNKPFANVLAAYLQVEELLDLGCRYFTIAVYVFFEKHFAESASEVSQFA